ncbi:hypothetical protein DSO57_1037493 [Entomophthora muscae]|uniref:Uncharacterized protein n=2 Tax=Entomophthora muscae TaxID=34485 RepID=A0ACC2RPS5_9FUNG|nr:hypothetical protein DSO57_1037828 [Entomophthora muscae]KAJ9083154.1 hypothetical protein DSO57_1037493 [Entomophthora muscae]
MSPDPSESSHQATRRRVLGQNPEKPHSLLEPTQLGPQRKGHWGSQIRGRREGRFVGRKLKIVASEASYYILAGGKDLLGLSSNILKDMHELARVGVNVVEGMGNLGPKIRQSLPNHQKHRSQGKGHKFDQSIDVYNVNRDFGRLQEGQGAKDKGTRQQNLH